MVDAPQYGGASARPVFPGDVPAPYTRKRFYTPKDVAAHNSGHDCWVSFFGTVCDLTPLLAAYPGPLAQPIIDAAGCDISSWFDAKTRQPKRYLHPDTGLSAVYCPQGRYIHVPPAVPDATWANDFA